MKISLKWLNEYIEIQDFLKSPDELAQMLTAAGIEVEGIENRARQFEHVVVGHILKKDQHPNADRLTLCQVSTGDGVVHQIVCGARNHNEGDRVVVALPGAILPGNFAIKRSKIRDVESGGMLCSEKELALNTASEGILILPADAPVGKSFAAYMGFDDVLFELKVTPNRADCLSHFGLAREVSALTGRAIKFPIESLIEDGGSTRQQVNVELRSSDLCPRYDGRGVKGVKVGPSPAWLKSRLESVGLKSINNVVDVTNFVMMELGQPLHAFDVREIKGRKLLIDRAVKGENFVTLDGSELKLEGDELTIRDAERAVALAGIVGGKNSGIQDDTTEIFIEAAYFTPGAVRRTARKFGIETDSSYRFARGTNPDAVPLALNRAAQLMQSVAGGRVMGEHYDLYPSPIRREPIEISLRMVEDRLGYKVEAPAFLQWMKRLECQVEPLTEKSGDTSANTWRILPPMFRWDLVIDMDLVEEYARLAGYQNIPETLPSLDSMPLTHDPGYLLEVKTRRLLQASCLQAINFAFVNRVFQDRVLGLASRLEAVGLRTQIGADSVSLVNPLTEELGVMRASLMPGLLANVMHNQRHSISRGRIYELGFSHFSSVGTGASSYGQEARLGFAFWGEIQDLWHKSESSPQVFQIKGVIENLLRGLGFEKWRWTQLAVKAAPDFLHPGQAAVLEVEGKQIGFIGSLHPSLASELKIRDKTALAEINLERLGDRSIATVTQATVSQGAAPAGAAAAVRPSSRSPRYQRISKMPAVERDLSFQMPHGLAASDVETEIRKMAGELLLEVKVVDVFSGGTLEAGTKSVSFRMVFQSGDATLEDQKINQISDAVVASCSKKFSISLRG